MGAKRHTNSITASLSNGYGEGSTLPVKVTKPGFDSEYSMEDLGNEDSWTISRHPLGLNCSRARGGSRATRVGRALRTLYVQLDERTTGCAGRACSIARGN